MEVFLIMASLAVFLFMRVPIAISLALSGAVGLCFIDMPMVVVLQRFYAGSENWVLTAIPLFILAGMIMESGGLSERMVNFADALLGFSPGGLANVNILASMIFGGISGSAVADSSALGQVLIPEMVKRGYTDTYSAAITASSSPIGMIIPPSIPMILWSFVSSESLGDLFLGGIIPGILVGLLLMAVSTFICVRRGYQPHGGNFSLSYLKKTLIDGIISLMAPVVIIGGIVSGLFTATESAVIAVVYAFCVTFFYYKELNLAKLPGILIRAGKSSAAIMFIIGSATAFSWVLTVFQVPRAIGGFLMSYAGSPEIFMLLTCFMFFVMGMFLDISVIILLIGPIIAPIIPMTGIPPIQAAMIFMMVLATGLITPPLGMCLFVVVSISKVKLEKVAVDCIPFVFVMISIAALIWFVPGIATYIPEAMAALRQ